MPLFLRLAPALLLCLSAAAAAQTSVVLFDERDVPGADYYGASSATASGGSSVALAGPDGQRLPLSLSAFRGEVSARLTYQQAAGGAWSAFLGAPGDPVDLTTADSLVLRLNGPAGVIGPEIPRLALEDADGDLTATLPLPFGGSPGYSAARSGFLPGSPTTAAFAVSYIDTRPSTQSRPGYPEDLTITFADVPLDTSLAAIGLPAVAARFRIDAASGLQLDFRFRDLDGDRTLGGAGEYIEILTRDAPGSTTQRVTWRVSVAATASVVPGLGSAYRLAVNNGGLDTDPATWQRLAIPLTDLGPLGAFDLSAVAGIRFSHGGNTDGARTLWIDAVDALDTGVAPQGPAPPTAIAPTPGDSSIVIRWTPTPGAGGVHVYRGATPAGPFTRLTARTVGTPEFADLSVSAGQSYAYILRSIAPLGGAHGPDSEPLVVTAAGSGEDPFLDLMAERAFDYFWHEANPANGLVKDRSTSGSAASIAAVGFGLTAIAAGIDRGYITREAGRERVLTTLRFFRTCPQSAGSTDICGYKGFFYHFLEMSTGHRAGTNELSTVDTALLLGGVLDMAVYFTGDHPDEAEIRRLAREINDRVDWPWASPRAPRISHGWLPETGFLGNDWVGYNEAMLVYLLALGSPTHPVGPEAWDAWTAGYGGQWATHYGFTFLTFPPLFGHQYSHLWVDFRDIQDAPMRARGTDYFENSRRATLAQRAYGIANPGRFPNYGPNEWGLTASDDPFGYRAHGAPPAQSDNGTITPTAPGGSIPFAPEETIASLRHMYERYGSQLWGRYGFRDAYNVQQNWVGQAFLGIDQGPFVIMIENLATGSVWDRFMTLPEIQAGLAAAGFTPSTDAEPDAESASLRLALAGPNPAAGATAVSFALPAPADVTLRVYDLLGREVATVASGPHAAGAHRVELDARAWAPGLYLLRLSDGASATTARLIVAR